MTETISKPKRVFDVEMFDLAARAAGITLEWWDDGESLNPGYVVNRESDWVSWDPLTNDGDALRLAVKLEINILPTMEEASARNPSHTGWINEDAARDPYAATRRAIVRAAAEIGRRMES